MIEIYDASEVVSLDIKQITEGIKSNPQISKSGMILVHNGIVRAFSRDGRPVSVVSVSLDEDLLKDIVDDAQKMDGIIEVRVAIRIGDLKLGEDMMLLAVAGDIREHVIACMARTLDRIKKDAVVKIER